MSAANAHHPSPARSIGRTKVKLSGAEAVALLARNFSALQQGNAARRDYLLVLVAVVHDTIAGQKHRPITEAVSFLGLSRTVARKLREELNPLGTFRRSPRKAPRKPAKAKRCGQIRDLGRRLPCRYGAGAYVGGGGA